jgi:hypothetical protein
MMIGFYGLVITENKQRNQKLPSIPYIPLLNSRPKVDSYYSILLLSRQDGLKA